MTTVTKLVANGFKSFANKTELSFGTDFNCILGPNGSGKSNVMDALCFVLGKSSAKGLRAEKSSNLIYNGGKIGKPAKEAEVSIWFKNDNDFPIDTKEVKISRILKKKGNSIYKINDKAHTRQQVVDLLGTAGIDPDGHSIVLQGDIVRFMEMRPIDRRLLIEEVAGISVFDDKKNKSMNELGHVQDRLNQVNIILTERETNLKELRKDRDQAKKFLDVKKKYKDSKATSIHLRKKQKETRKEEIEKNLSNYNSRLEKTDNKIKEYKENIESKQTEIKEINEVLDERGEQEQKLLQMEISSLTADIAKHESRSETIKNELQKIAGRIKQIRSESSESTGKIKELEKEKIKFSKELETIKNSEKELKDKISEFKEKHGLNDLGDFSTKLDDVDNEIERKRNLISSALETKQDLIREIDLSQFQIDQLNETLKKLSGKNEGKKIKQLKKDIGELDSKLNKLKGERDLFESQISRNSTNLLDNNEKLAKVKEKSAGARERMFGDMAVKKILEDKGKGVYGTVSELGEVDEKFSLALEIAAGMRAKSIVVDSDATAAKYIRMLKTEKMGIATFLPLNKIKKRVKKSDFSAILKKPGVHGYAVDLINFQPKFSTIFDYVFGGTIIVENIEAARKIGVGRARMVTLTGDVLEPSGAMVGGHRKKTGLGFSQKKIDTDLEKFENERTRLDRLISDVYSQKEEVEEAITSVREEKAELEGELIKLEKSLGITSNTLNHKKDIEELIKNKEDQGSELKSIESDLVNFEGEIVELQKHKQTVKEGLTKKESSGIDKLEEEYNELFKDKLEIESKIKDIDNKINMISTESNRFGEIEKQSSTDKEGFIEEEKNLAEVLKNKKLTLKEKEKENLEFYGRNKNLAAKRNKVMEFIKTIQDKISKEESGVESVKQKKYQVDINKAKLIAEIEALTVEFEEFKEGIIRRGVNLNEIEEEVKKYDRIMKNLGNVNMRALEVYDQIREEYDKLLEKVNTLKSEKEDVLTMIDEIEQKKKFSFMKTFKELGEKFSTTFGYLYSKGEAELSLENAEEPLEGGVSITVKTGKNKYLDIRSLSGGEKTLAALSFIFAIQEHKPASFYLMDEVDAALDKHNSEKLSKLFSNYSDKAQYIVISHNDAIIGEANQIYGVTMNKDKDISKVVSLKV